MQWLTAILAFATTMLVFAVVVSTIVETIHRTVGSRTIGLKRMLEHYYDQVIQPHLKLNAKAGVKLSRDEFIRMMTRVRAPITQPDKQNKRPGSDSLTRWSFRLLTQLSTESFMERLGSSNFSAVLTGQPGTDNPLLKDLAQKYVMFGEESSLHFESKARLLSVAVALIVAWAFYVHPYNLIQTYLKNPDVAERVAALADEPIVRYQKLIAEVESLKENDQTPLNKADLDKLIKQLDDDVKAAKVEVRKLSTAGAPVGWPDTNVEQIVWFRFDKPIFKMPFYYPTQLKDIFWLLMGGLLVGLGSPFWVKLITQMTQAQSVSKNVASILTPSGESQTVVTQATTAPNVPTSSEAFLVAAKASK